MKHLKYYCAILLSALCLVVPGVALIVLANNTCQTTIIAFVVSVAFGVLTWKPAEMLRISSRRDVEYDEFGMSKRKQYEKLSRAERDAIDLQRVADAERLISTTAIKKMTKSGSEDPDKDLQRLVGLTPVKQKVREMAARMAFDRDAEKTRGRKGKRKEGSVAVDSGKHMVFFGSPGTGKTTVAKILTGFLYKYGYIKENKYIETDGNFLKAGTDTALKTTLVARKAYGGVLFIDEAYALMSGDGYGQDAIATLIKEMEDNRGRFVVILAGYTNEMKMLLRANPGFESRVKEYLSFPDYSDAELKEIFRLMANEHGFVVDEGAFDALETRLQKERPLHSFGNARTVRNILDESLDKHALNYANHHLDENKRFVICGVDIPLSTTTNAYG